MKAYIYELDDHVHVGYLADGEDPDMHWIDAKRAEWADVFAPNMPPAQAWMDNGYQYTCAHCEHLVGSDGYCDECQDESETNLGGIVFDGCNVYCNSVCQEAERAEWEQRAASKAKAVAAFAAKFPFATVTDAWVGGIPHCDCFKNNANNACLHWTVPGATQGAHANSYCGGCDKAWVCNGDREAFDKARSTNEELRMEQPNHRVDFPGAS
jgi:hypothetical protein